MLGADHPNVFGTASLRIGVQLASGESGDASNELPVLIAALARAVGAHNTMTLRARYRLARCRMMRGQADEARTEANEILAAFDPATDPNHELRQTVRKLLAKLDGNPIDGDLPT